MVCDTLWAPSSGFPERLSWHTDNPARTPFRCCSRSLGFQVLFGQPFGLAWGGVLFQVVKEREAQIIYSKILAYVYVLALGLALILTILGPTLFRILTASAFYPAIVLLPWVLLVRAMNVVEQPAATGLYLSGRTRTFALIYTIAMLSNVIALSAFVPKYGILGVGWAWLLGSALVPILNLLFGQRTYPLRFNVKLMCFAALPWVLAITRVPGYVGRTLHGQVATECLLCLIVVVFMSILLALDLRGLREQIRVQNEAPSLESVSL